MPRVVQRRGCSGHGRSGCGFALCAAWLAWAATIPLGSVGFLESRLVAALAWLTGIAGIAWSGPRTGEIRRVSSRLAWAATAALAVWCGWQLLPLSGHWANPVWRGDPELLKELMADADGWSIALDRFVSLHAVLLWSGLGLLAWACSRRLRGHRAVHTFLYGLVLTGVFQSVLGIFILKAPGARICGTFGSPNALGGLLAMTLPVTLGLALSRTGQRTLRGRTGFRWWLHRLGDSWHVWRGPALWTAWGLQWAALYFTGSMGATLASAAACGSLLAWQGKERAEFRRWFWALGACLAALLVVLGIHARSQNVLDRTLGDSGEFQQSKDSRIEIWRSAWQLCRMFPQGTGPGGSAMALPMFQSGVHGRYQLDYAHNDALQFLGDLGMPGFVPLVCLLGLVLWRGAQASRRSLIRDGDSVWLFRGAWLAVVAALLHAQVEYNLSARPGIQVAFAILCGILWGAPTGEARGTGTLAVRAEIDGRIGMPLAALLPAGLLAVVLSLAAAWSWHLREGAAAALDLPPDENQWFRRSVLAPAEVLPALHRACQLAPGSSILHRTSAEARRALHQRRIQDVARTLLAPAGADAPAVLELDPFLPAHAQALGEAELILRLEEIDVLRAALADADSAVRCAPWNAPARLARAAILLRGATLKSLGAEAEARGRRDLDIATALYPQDAFVLAAACAALSRGTNSDRDAKQMLAWGSQALLLDASMAGTVLDAWWRGKVSVSRVLELPRIPLDVLWSLYVRLDKLNRTEDARLCLAALEHMQQEVRPPEASLLWAPATWKRWEIRQTQYRIRLAGERLKCDLRAGNWESVAALAPIRARALHDRFQMELDQMELSGSASPVLRRLRLREWAAAGRLSPEWMREWALLESAAGMPARQLQEPLAETILMEGLDAEQLARLRAGRIDWAEAPLLAALLAAKEAELAGRTAEAASGLAAVLESGNAPTRFVHRLWLWRANLLRQTGDAEAAESARRQAARICPSDPDVASAPPESGTKSDLNVGFFGGRLMLMNASLDPARSQAGESRLQLTWRFLGGGLPSDLRLDVLIRDAEGYARFRKSIRLDQDPAAQFNRGAPPIGSSWTWTIPLSSFAAQSRMVEVRVRSVALALPSDDGLGVIELNLEKLPRAGSAD